jgi:hypothetical protein
MVTWAIGTVILVCASIWSAIEYRRLGQRGGVVAAITVGAVAGIALVGFIYVLETTDNPWAWIGLPMACRYTLHGC